MLTIVEGSQGSGKTYWAVKRILDILFASSRRVVTNLPLNVAAIEKEVRRMGWKPPKDDPSQLVGDRVVLLTAQQAAWFWKHSKSGDAILIDEAYELFGMGAPPGGASPDEASESSEEEEEGEREPQAPPPFGSEVKDEARRRAEMLAACSQHRHRLQDLYLLCQSRSQISGSVRRAAGQFLVVQNTKYLPLFGSSRNIKNKMESFFRGCFDGLRIPWQNFRCELSLNDANKTIISKLTEWPDPKVFACYDSFAGSSAHGVLGAGDAKSGNTLDYGRGWRGYFREWWQGGAWSAAFVVLVITGAIIWGPDILAGTKRALTSWFVTGGKSLTGAPGEKAKRPIVPAKSPAPTARSAGAVVVPPGAAAPARSVSPAPPAGVEGPSAVPGAAVPAGVSPVVVVGPSGSPGVQQVAAGPAGASSESGGVSSRGGLSLAEPVAGWLPAAAEFEDPSAFSLAAEWPDIWAAAGPFLGLRGRLLVPASAYDRHVEAASPDMVRVIWRLSSVRLQRGSDLGLSVELGKLFRAGLSGLTWSPDLVGVSVHARELAGEAKSVAGGDWIMSAGEAAEWFQGVEVRESVGLLVPGQEAVEISGTFRQVGLKVALTAWPTPAGWVVKADLADNSPTATQNIRGWFISGGCMAWQRSYNEERRDGLQIPVPVLRELTTRKTSESFQEWQFLAIEVQPVQVSR